MFEISLISKYRKELMGIAIIWITLYHCIADPVEALGIPVLRAILNRGYLGVEMFLFLSGIGLYHSMHKNDAVRPFYLRRCTRTAIPWLMLSLPYWIVKTLILDKMSFRAMLLNWCGASFWLFGVKSVWYVAFLLVLYALYPLIFRIQRKRRGIVWGMIAAAFVLNIVLLTAAPGYYEKTELAFARIPVFLLGSLTGEALQSERRSPKQRLLPVSYLAVMLILYAIGMLSADYGLNLMPEQTANMLNRLGGQGVALPVTAGFCVLFERCCAVRLRKAAAFFGGFTLELYLLHVFLGHFAERAGFDASRSIPVQFLVQSIVIALSVFGAWGFSRCRGRKR